MRSLFILTIISLSVWTMQAQSPSPNAVCPAAATQSNSSMTVTWQLGTLPFILPPANGAAIDDGVTAEAFQLDMSVYPNPAADYINLQFDFPLEEDIQVQVTDAQGRVWATATEVAFATQLLVDTQHLPKGIYSINIYANEERIAQRQLVKAND